MNVVKLQIEPHSNVYFISDTHFNHANVVRYANRPYKDCDEMNESLINNWNKVVRKTDHIFCVGDFCFGPIDQICSRLNGIKYLIIGSHDRVNNTYNQYFKGLYNQLELIITDPNPYMKYNIILNHTALRTWEKSHYGALHLFGHQHHEVPTLNLSWNVCVDTALSNYTPISFDVIKQLYHERVKQLIETNRVVKSERNGAYLYQQDDVAYLLQKLGE